MNYSVSIEFDESNSCHPSSFRSRRHIKDMQAARQEAMRKEHDIKVILDTLGRVSTDMAIAKKIKDWDAVTTLRLETQTLIEKWQELRGVNGKKGV